MNKSNIRPSATAYFTARVDARDNRGSMTYERITRKFKVTPHKEGGRWLLFNFSAADANNTGDTSAPANGTLAQDGRVLARRE